MERRAPRTHVLVPLILLALCAPARAITVNCHAGEHSNAPNFTFTTPTGATSTDLLFCMVTLNGSATVVTPPTGWTAITPLTPDGGGTKSQAYYLQLAAAPAATYTWTTGGAVSFAAGSICALSGAATGVAGTVSSIVRAQSEHDNQSGATTTTLTATAVTATSADLLLVAYGWGAVPRRPLVHSPDSLPHGT